MEASEVSDAGDVEPLLRLENFLPYRLNVLAAAVSEGLARVYSERFGIDIPGWRVLATLGQFGPLASKMIGAHSRMHKTKVSRAVAHLEERGLVRRAVNPGDKREGIATLTDKGAAVYRKIVPLALAYEREVLAAFPREDARRLDAALALLADSARRLNGSSDASS
jgi:DNA-binding MarR family transcriptional regulator